MLTAPASWASSFVRAPGGRAAPMVSVGHQAVGSVRLKCCWWMDEGPCLEHRPGKLLRALWCCPIRRRAAAFSVAEGALGFGVLVWPRVHLPGLQPHLVPAEPPLPEPRGRLRSGGSRMGTAGQLCQSPWSCRRPHTAPPQTSSQSRPWLSQRGGDGGGSVPCGLWVRVAVRSLPFMAMCGLHRRGRRQVLGWVGPGPAP